MQKSSYTRTDAPRLERLRARADDGRMRPGAAAAIDCPTPAPSRRTVYARTLHRACMVVGGLPELAAKLRATETALRAWIEGVEDPPESFFLAAVEILLLQAEEGRGIAS